MTDLVVSRDRLYRLLPALYRLRDAAVGEPLRALLAVMESELATFEDDVAGLYESFFIETCPEWVVPYIAELLDVRGLPPSRFLSARSYVAHAIGYRRRKGTLSVLPELVGDVTGWPVRAVESFPLLSRTQHLLNPRLSNFRTPLLRKRDALSLAGSPFDTVQHMLDVRRKYHPRKIGLYVWRTLSLRASNQPAVLLPGQDPNGTGPLIYTFSPSGAQIPLFSPGIATANPGNAAALEASYPGPLRPQAIAVELAVWERAALQGRVPDQPVYFGAQPVFRIVIERADKTRTELRPSDLLTAKFPSNLLSFVMPVRNTPPCLAAVDVACGCFAIARNQVPAGATVYVDYSYGAAAEIGGGYAHEKSSVYEAADRPEIVSVRGGETSSTSCVIGSALTQLNLSDSATPRTVIVQIEDSQRYRLKQATLGRNIKLELRAADGQRPYLIRDPSLGNTPASFALRDGATLSLDGVYLGDALSVNVLQTAHVRFEVQHATLGDVTFALVSSAPAPSAPSGLINFTDAQSDDDDDDAPGGSLIFTARRSDLGSVTDFETLHMSGRFEDCAIAQLQMSHSAISLRGCTVFGTTQARELTLISDSLLVGRVTAISAEGTLRYSYLPPDSQAPPGHNCQPELASRDGSDPQLCKPVFAATRSGFPGRYRLAEIAHPALRTGASDGGELGVMHHAGARQRQEALREALDDSLRINLEAEIYSAT